MSVITSNAYGKISISDLAIAKVAAQAAVESYGIVDTVARRFSDTLAELLNRRCRSRQIRRFDRGCGGIVKRGRQVQGRAFYGHDRRFGKRQYRRFETLILRLRIFITNGRFFHVKNDKLRDFS